MMYKRAFTHVGLIVPLLIFHLPRIDNKHLLKKHTPWNILYIYTASHYRAYINICMVNARKNINKLQSTQSRKANNYIQIKFIYTQVSHIHNKSYICVCVWIFIYLWNNKIFKRRRRSRISTGYKINNICFRAKFIF